MVKGDELVQRYAGVRARFERVIRVSVRVIPATNRDLGELVRQEKFREDLYYRLCVAPIRVPPLRNTIERMAILTPGERLRVESMPAEIRLGRDAPARSSLQEARYAPEREHLLRALEQSNWNVTAAARLVGVERTNLHKRIRALGLSRSGTP